VSILVNTDEDLLRVMIENAPDGFFIHDIKGKIIDANKAAYESLGYTKTEMLSMAVADIEVSLDHEMLIATTWPSIKHKESVQVQGVHRCKNGKEIPIQVNITCFKKPDQTLFLALVRDISASEEIKAHLSKLAMTDELTQIANRRAFMAGLASEISFVERNEEQLSFLMIDLDHFKLINDQYGHSVGDEVLKQFANTANKVLRTEDLFGRLGGEEFAVLLRNTDLELAKILAERLRTSISQMVVAVEGASVKFTVSIGVSSFSPPSDLDSLIKYADKALYKAKERGRNCVVSVSGKSLN
jgi:diguanylate cyclase (GGDEF)-like protein/PAS domain S-box-containing protein